MIFLPLAFSFFRCLEIVSHCWKFTVKAENWMIATVFAQIALDFIKFKQHQKSTNKSTPKIFCKMQMGTFRHEVNFFK